MQVFVVCVFTCESARPGTEKKVATTRRRITTREGMADDDDDMSVFRSNGR